MQIKRGTYQDYRVIRDNISLVFLIIILLLAFAITGCSKKGYESVSKTDKNDTTIKQMNNNDTVRLVKLSYEQEQGSFLFHKYCAVCHGETGKGNGFNAYSFNPRPRNFTDSVFAASLNLDRLQIAITKGGKGVGKSALMHPYGSTLKNNEIEYLARYILFMSSHKK